MNTSHKAGFLSERIRMKAQEIIVNKGRPMAASEVEAHFRLYESKMWSEISKKCNDYIRIILSLAKGNMFPKYRSVYQIPDVDKRSIFFGSNTVEYDAEMWEPIPQKPETKAEEESEPEEKSNTLKATQEPKVEMVSYEPINTNIRNVDFETAGQSWNNLSSNIPMSDQTWREITQAIYEIGEVYRLRHNSPDLLSNLYKKYKTLAQSKQRIDIDNILMREMQIRQELQNSISVY